MLSVLLQVFHNIWAEELSRIISIEKVGLGFCLCKGMVVSMRLILVSVSLIIPVYVGLFLGIQ